MTIQSAVQVLRPMYGHQLLQPHRKNTQITLLKDTLAVLEEMYEISAPYYKELTMYIAGKKS